MNGARWVHSIYLGERGDAQADSGHSPLLHCWDRPCSLLPKTQAR